MAIAAGGLITVAQLVMLPFDPKDHVATSQSGAFQVGGVVYMLGFLALMLALVGLYAWEAHRAGRFGLVAVSTAIVGTMMLGGDLWFETFAVPSIADGPAAAQVLNGDPSMVLGLGAIASYLLFAHRVGHVRDRELPGPGVPEGALHRARHRRDHRVPGPALAPFAIPLGIAVGALGVWMIRTTRRATIDRVPAPAYRPAQRARLRRPDLRDHGGRAAFASGSALRSVLGGRPATTTPDS